MKTIIIFFVSGFTTFGLLELFFWLRRRRKEREIVDPFSELRLWVAVSPSAKVSLGRCKYATALKRAKAIGPVSYTDIEHAFIFVNVPGHSGQDAPGVPGIS